MEQLPRQTAPESFNYRSSYFNDHGLFQINFLPSDKCNLNTIEPQIGYNTNKGIPGGAAIAIL
ncbi:hypothetical protein KNP414_03838 [Paenibacillus mucilaginosus KNP414]|uniref:Uncharacterized protein n=1 Tax=Paenibacillus mucilaginosus (strain KNP414) TaxID=1036673 RepID=F8F6A3_PAEMK|nr:hypothetical protein KNP414_03838 [Paenibacillus mucilaginosus KNP414]